MSEPKKTRKVLRLKWKDGKPPLKFVLDWYDAWLRCDQLKKVCAALEIPAQHLGIWMKVPELKLAKELADERRGTNNTFRGYIYKHLSPEAREVWERCQFFDQENAYTQVEKILNGQSKRIRQELFLHALVSANFDLSEAMRMVALERTTFEHWRNKDFEFRQLVEEIQWHKKNFFERALVDLVEERHPAAVLFVNRTMNAERGYGEKMKVEHSLGQGFRLDELELDLDTKRKILDAMRRKSVTPPTTLGNGPVVDVDTTPVPQIPESVPASPTEDEYEEVGL